MKGVANQNADKKSITRRTLLTGAAVGALAATSGSMLTGCDSRAQDVQAVQGTLQKTQEQLENVLADVRLLMDKLEIMGCQYKYALGVDSKDSSILTDAFDEIIDVYYPLTGTKLDACIGAEMAAGLVMGLDGIVTQHMMTNFTIEVDGDTAKAKTYLRAMHIKPDSPQYEVGGYYENTYVRTTNGWKIKTVMLNNTYDLGESYFSR
jgi:hypothetical protein